MNYLPGTQNELLPFGDKQADRKIETSSFNLRKHKQAH